MKVREPASVAHRHRGATRHRAGSEFHGGRLPYNIDDLRAIAADYLRQWQLKSRAAKPSFAKARGLFGSCGASVLANDSKPVSGVVRSAWCVISNRVLRRIEIGRKRYLFHRRSIVES
jgi:hypothetical protein